MGLLEGKNAIVTGSARGIGRATAELFAAHGAKVLINDLDADIAEQTASEIDGETAVFGGDLTKGDACDQLVHVHSLETRNHIAVASSVLVAGGDFA